MIHWTKRILFLLDSALRSHILFRNLSNFSNFSHNVFHYMFLSLSLLLYVYVYFCISNVIYYASPRQTWATFKAEANANKRDRRRKNIIQVMEMNRNEMIKFS